MFKLFYFGARSEEGGLPEKSSDKTGLSRISYGVLLGFIFLLPFFFVPSPLVTYAFGKSVFTGVVIIAVFALYLITVLKKGTFMFPRSFYFLPIPILLVIYFLASIFSQAPIDSLIGLGFEYSTFSFVLLMFVLLFLISQLFQSKERIFYAYLAFFASFLILALFHFLRFIFGEGFMSFGYFPQMVSNTVGKWSDLGVFFGITVILALITLEELRLQSLFRKLIYIVLVLSLIFLLIVNKILIWYVLGGLALLFLVYNFSAKSKAPQGSTYTEGVQEGYGMPEQSMESASDGSNYAKMSVPAIFLLAVSVLFILAGDGIDRQVSSFLNITNIDVRPGWVTTIDIAQGTLSEKPILGAGPNRFVTQWYNHKPVGVNLLPYWNTEFNYGIGFIPTQLITTGIVGFLGWLLFLGSFIFLGLHTIFRRSLNPLDHYSVISSFFVSLFLWMMLIVYVPSTTIFVMTFLFTGLFFASVLSANLIPQLSIPFFRYPRASFVTVLILVLLLLSSMVFGYFVVQKTLASMYFQRSALAMNADNLSQAEDYMIQAVNLSESDVYYRALAQINMTQADRIVEKLEGSNLTDADAANFRQNYSDAISAAQQATKLNTSNYRNWLLLGQVFQRGVEYGIPGAYKRSAQSYKRAVDNNPTNPELQFRRARLEVANGDYEAARDYIARARELKPNYTEAIYLLAQIDTVQGRIDEAIVRTEQAILTSDSNYNAGLYFQLGLLRYSKEDYTRAANAFQEAVRKVPQYANAHYFLGLSHYWLGDTEQAIAQFERLAEITSDNEHVQQILSNLRSGEPLFDGTNAPVTGEITEGGLPVEEPENTEVSEETTEGEEVPEDTESSEGTTTEETTDDEVQE